MNYQELIERLHIKAGHNQYKFSDALMIEAANAIESLLAENERLAHNLATTEQTMREYQELAAKRLGEIDRLKDERESHGPEGRNYTNLQVVEMRLLWRGLK